MSAFRPILFIIGIFVVTMGLAMIVPAITDAIAGHRDWITFAISAGCAAFVGGLMVTGSMGSPITLTLRQGFALTTLSWIVFRSEAHTSELQSLMRISYAVFCLKKKI